MGRQHANDQNATEKKNEIAEDREMKKSQKLIWNGSRSQYNKCARKDEGETIWWIGQVPKLSISLSRQ